MPTKTRIDRTLAILRKETKQLGTSIYVDQGNGVYSHNTEKLYTTDLHGCTGALFYMRFGDGHSEGFLTHYDPYNFHKNINKVVELMFEASGKNVTYKTGVVIGHAEQLNSKMYKQYLNSIKESMQLAYARIARRDGEKNPPKINILYYKKNLKYLILDPKAKTWTSEQHGINKLE